VLLVCGVLRFGCSGYQAPELSRLSFIPFSHLPPFSRANLLLQLASDSHGIAALAIRDGRAHKPEQQATYFDGDWEGTVNKVRFTFALCVSFR
jgi:hypothetical protein